MHIEKILQESADGILTDETQKLMKEAFEAEVEKRVAERVQLEIDEIDKKAADELKSLVESIDKQHADQYKTLLEANDADHLQKMDNLVKEMDKSYTVRLKLVKEHYEVKQVQEMENFKNTLLEAIDQHIDNVLDEKIPADVFHKAASSYVEKKNPVKESVKPVQKRTLLESLTKDFPKEKKDFIVSRLKDKNDESIKKNFNYVVNMFEKSTANQKQVIAESAIRQSIDSHAEKKAEVSAPNNEIDPLMQSYIIKCTQD